jgi:maltose O-acetyltransferase
VQKPGRYFARAPPPASEARKHPLKESIVPTEKDKMLRGELYNAADPQLVLERRRARNLLKAFNQSLDEAQEERRRILAELLGALGDNVAIEPPFYCDYGSNITLGSGVFFNFNCVVLDVARVEMGSNVLFGPNV